MVVVIVDGKEYNLNAEQIAAMKYIDEAEAIEKGSTVIFYIFRSPSRTSIKRHLTSSFKFCRK